MGLLLGKTVIVLAIICTPLLFAPRAESAIPAPPIPYVVSQPLSPSGFLVAEEIYGQDWTRGTFYLLTVLNGTSGSFDLEIRPSDPCKDGCRGWEFPLNIELRLSFRPIDDLVMTDWGGKHRQLSGVSAPPGGYDSVVEDISVTISPNPVALKLGDTVKVKVTITAKPSAIYGLYEVRLATRIDGASISGGLLFLKTTNIMVGLDTKYYNVMGFQKEATPEQRRNLYTQYPNIKSSERFANSSWFVLESNGTLKASYDGTNYQHGWWEIKGDEITFMLPDANFIGKKGHDYDIVLYDNSVWRWSGLTGGFPPRPIIEGPAPVFVEGWRSSAPFLPKGFCSIEKGWAGNYPNATIYVLTRGTSASLDFTIMSIRNFSFPLTLNLSLIGTVMRNDTIRGSSAQEVEDVSISVSPANILLRTGDKANVRATLTATADAPEGLYGMHFESPRQYFNRIFAVAPPREGYKPVGPGEPVLFFLKVQGSCQDSMNELLLYAAGVGIALVLGFGLLYIRKGKTKTVSSFS